MTTSTLRTAASGRVKQAAGVSTAAVLNLLGVVAGGAVALAGLMGWGGAPVFFSGLAAAFFCLDAVRQSWW
ncbi:MAG: hypothetical protein HDR45_03765 [Bacteroides sp.]|nr:hypothetical protein [Bacteroides sp.]MBD5415382.1 hypothetical protein [Bacteroides sp.]MBD5425299.1 hypothetical protein [Bacteroides sp.]